jgi:hypothetical protein
MDRISFSVDASEVVAALSSLPTATRLLCKEAAHVTANNIANDARARVAHRGPDPTRAQQGRPPIEHFITVQEMTNDRGYVVVVQEPPQLYLPWELEYGTEFMDARPFFFSSAVIEYAAHSARMNDALVRAVALAAEARGLGDA